MGDAEDGHEWRLMQAQAMINLASHFGVHPRNGEAMNALITQLGLKRPIDPAEVEDVIRLGRLRT